MKKHAVIFSAVFVIAAFIIGCGPKSPVMQDGKQVAMFVLSDRGINNGLKESERNDHNEVGQFMEEDLLNTLKHEGYNATLIQNRDQYVQGPANYLVIVKIDMLRLVGRSARYWLGYAAGPTILHTHYEVSGAGNKTTLAYKDEDSTTRDWSSSPREVNERLVKKINDYVVGK